MNGRASLPGASPGSAAGRPRMTRSARRAQLLDAAREVFGAHGYHAAAMDEIAERAGVSKPVLYQHFPGKLDLYRALVQGAADDMVRTVRAAIRSTTDNKARVQATIQAYFDVVSSRDGAMRLVFETDTRATPEIAGLVDRATSDCIDAVTEAVTTDAGPRARARPPARRGPGGPLHHRRALLARRRPAAAPRGRDHADVPARLARHRRLPPARGIAARRSDRRALRPRPDDPD